LPRRLVSAESEGRRRKPPAKAGHGEVTDEAGSPAGTKPGRVPRPGAMLSLAKA